MIEKWKPIPGYEGLYAVSNLGRIKSFRNPKRPIIRKLTTFGKYRTVTFAVHCERRIFAVHRLVAEAFIPNPQNKPTVNHKNGKNRLNNRVTNLEWATYPENTTHALTTGLRIATRGSRTHTARLTTKDIKTVIALRRKGHKLVTIAARFGVTHPTIIRILNGKGWKHAPRK